MAHRLQPGEKLVIATHNPGKLREIAALLAPLGVAAISAGELGLPEPEEDAPDFAGNAAIKALAAATASGLPALADDSGFCVAALGGAPGVVSARWAGPGKDFALAMARVNTELGKAEDRRAWFIAALCLAWPDGHTATPHRRHRHLAATRAAGLRLRSDIHPQRRHSDLRRNGPGCQTRHQPPGASVRAVGACGASRRPGVLTGAQDGPKG